MVFFCVLKALKATIILLLRNTHNDASPVDGYRYELQQASHHLNKSWEEWSRCDELISLSFISICFLIWSLGGASFNEDSRGVAGLHRWARWETVGSPSGPTTYWGPKVTLSYSFEWQPFAPTFEIREYKTITHLHYRIHIYRYQDSSIRSLNIFLHWMDGVQLFVT